MTRDQLFDAVHTFNQVTHQFADWPGHFVIIAGLGGTDFTLEQMRWMTMVFEHGREIVEE